ncbi:MAG TPA: FAD-dependent oxidoreductase [Aestuariivirgaceae bacterium]|nr:FAD-dependent oxidoreductase [Aestuariivirgaceae bacterium]
MPTEPYKALFRYDYVRSPDQDGAAPVHHPVIVVGAGPIGLAAATDLAQRGIPVVVLDDSDRIAEGSRAICFSKRALEVADRLGVGERMVEKGVVWKVGKIFSDTDLVYQFDLLPEPGHKRPAFINLQQYYVEAWLVERARELTNIDLRWRNRVVSVTPREAGAEITVETPDGPYRLTCDWLIACDGARSSVRSSLGLEFVGQAFDDRFLIVDVRMKAGFPPERWFWFDPPFHHGQSALLHKQPDDIWRIDFQLGRDADPDDEKRFDRVEPRLRAMLGGEAEFEIQWVSVYTFQCKRMERFVHDRVVFAGDAAHQVSPFGARGANSGFEDAHNLAWKLAAIIAGEAPAGLIDSYAAERELAADDNIGHSTRATDFISPKSPVARVFRNAVLKLAGNAGFARAMINSGRLSTPSVYDASPLNTPDADDWNGAARIGAAPLDAPLRDAGGRETWLLDELSDGFTAICVSDDARPDVPEGITLKLIGEELIDAEGLFRARYDARPGSTYLFRPDQYLCARFRAYDAETLAAARLRALGRQP